MQKIKIKYQNAIMKIVQILTMLLLKTHLKKGIFHNLTYRIQVRQKFIGHSRTINYALFFLAIINFISKIK